MNEVKFKSKEDKRKGQKMFANMCYKDCPVKNKNDREFKDHHMPGLAFYKSNS